MRLLMNVWFGVRVLQAKAFTFGMCISTRVYETFNLCDPELIFSTYLFFEIDRNIQL